jgi:ATPase
VDFATQKLAYEIYTYGEENVIMTIGDSSTGGNPAKSPVQELAKERIQQTLRKYDSGAEIEFLSDDRISVRVGNSSIARLIGRKGQNIEALEKSLGIRITVEPRDGTTRQAVEHSFEESGGHFSISVDPVLVGKEIDVYSGEELLLSAAVGGRGSVRIRKKTPLGRRVLQAHYSGKLRVLAAG